MLQVIPLTTILSIGGFLLAIPAFLIGLVAGSFTVGTRAMALGLVIALLRSLFAGKAWFAVFAFLILGGVSEFGHWICWGLAGWLGRVFDSFPTAVLGTGAILGWIFGGIIGLVTIRSVIKQGDIQAQEKLLKDLLEIDLDS